VTDRALLGHPVALNHAAAQPLCDCLASRLVSTGAAPRMIVFNEERPKLYCRFAGGLAATTTLRDGLNRGQPGFGFQISSVRLRC
jgi:hypothetical protein